MTIAEQIRELVLEHGQNNGQRWDVPASAIAAILDAPAVVEIPAAQMSFDADEGGGDDSSDNA